MRWVGAKTVVAASPLSVREAAGAFDTTTHAAGAVTVKRNVALRSGCSNTAKTRRLSGTSNCE